MKRLWITVMLCSLSVSANAAEWQIDPQQSHLRFSGEHAGEAFRGEFKRFEAAIRLDLQKPEDAAIEVVIDTASATTGNALYDKTLPSADWFAAEDHPKARFVSTEVVRLEKTNFLAYGTLSIRGISKKVTLPFTLVPSDKPQGAYLAEGTIKLNRLDFDIGKSSDATAEWVSADIPVTLRLVATPKK